jgi:NAD(P)-dependent dehydrogenase (short-subunit alcohol dehydrogenase family)
MKVVLADVEEPALAQTAMEMKACGADVLSVVVNVSQSTDVAALARQTMDTYGAVHLLCNNAGVGAGTTAWESSLNDWQWGLGVNLWGVIHGLRAFVPLMLEQGDEGHIVNTASIAGLTSYHLSAPYHVSKHAVVALSEKLYYDMAARGGRINVSVLCPDWVNTQIVESSRNRPVDLMDDSEESVMAPEKEAAIEEMRQAVAAGMPPDEIAGRVFQAVEGKQFYILTHPELAPYVQARVEALMQGKNPPLM